LTFTSQFSNAGCDANLLPIDASTNIFTESKLMGTMLVGLDNFWMVTFAAPTKVKTSLIINRDD
jgi:hypothetical protein